MTGGGYSLAGGFWNIVSLAQTPGAPTLNIQYSGRTVIISWPANGAFVLQQNGSLSTPGGWAASGYPVKSSNGTNSVSFTPPAGSLFFRLAAQ